LFGFGLGFLFLIERSEFPEDEKLCSQQFQEQSDRGVKGVGNLVLVGLLLQPRLSLREEIKAGNIDCTGRDAGISGSCLRAELPAPHPLPTDLTALPEVAGRALRLGLASDSGVF